MVMENIESVIVVLKLTGNFTNMTTTVRYETYSDLISSTDYNDSINVLLFKLSAFFSKEY